MNKPRPGTFVMPFGKFRDKSLDEIAMTDKGLLYLDWCAGEFSNGCVKRAIVRFLEDPTIAKELQRLLEED